MAIKRSPLKRYKPLKKSTKPIKRNVPIKAQTTDERVIKEQLSSLKKGIELDAIQDGEYFCKGCGQSYLGLDKSHILPVDMYKHLELVKKNIQLLCRDCHNIWEHGSDEDKKVLLCFDSNTKIIQELIEEFGQFKKNK